MKQTNVAFWGIGLIAVGCLFLLGNLLDVAVFRFLWPVGLIVLGIWLILPKTKSQAETSHNDFISDISRQGQWEVTDTSYSAFISDMKLDMTEALIPEGETALRLSGFIGDIKIRIPDDVGVRMTTSAFIGENQIFGEKRSGFLSPVTLQTADYKSASRRLNIQASYFISDMKVWAGEKKAVLVNKEAQAAA